MKIEILNVYKLINFLRSQKSSIEVSSLFEQSSITFSYTTLLQKACMSKIKHSKVKSLAEIHFHDIEHINTGMPVVYCVLI